MSDFCFYLVSFIYESAFPSLICKYVEGRYEFFFNSLPYQLFRPISVLKWFWLTVKLYFNRTMFPRNGAFSIHFPSVSATG